MTKLRSIKITGFKDPSRNVFLKFSEEPVTVIFGQNGSGKTTLLKVIHAIFNKDEEYLLSENVKEIELIYEKENKHINTINIKLNNKGVTWSDNIKDLTKKTSILFGVNRGVIQDPISIDTNTEANMYLRHLRNELYHSKSKSRRIDEIRYLDELEYLTRRSLAKNTNLLSEDWYRKNHISVDQISISDIENSIIRQHRAGQRATSDKVKNAFFNTISSAVDIEIEQKNYELPIDFNQRINEKRSSLLSLIEKLDKSPLQSKLLGFLNGEEQTSEVANSKIFRAMLANILDKAEEENVELKSIDQLVLAFNNHLYNNKQLVVTDDNAVIEFPNGTKHKIEKLSSGERHLLTFLTLFLIIGRNRDFFIIDEPEISLNMKWQRHLMPLLNELSPNAQIIVATHSPSIANKNSNYLTELI